MQGWWYNPSDEDMIQNTTSRKTSKNSKTAKQYAIHNLYNLENVYSYKTCEETKNTVYSVLKKGTFSKKCYFNVLFFVKFNGILQFLKLTQKAEREKIGT